MIRGPSRVDERQRYNILFFIMWFLFFIGINKEVMFVLRCEFKKEKKSKFKKNRIKNEII